MVSKNLSLQIFAFIGSSENDCKTCSNGFTLNENTCVSNCANGNYFDKDENVSHPWNYPKRKYLFPIQVCKMCTNDCHECLSPGSYCRQCVYPMALETIAHRCLPCCATNLTTDDCCQCPLSWDGKSWLDHP